MAFCVFAGIAVIVNEARGTPSLKAPGPQRRVGPVVAMMEAEGEGPRGEVGPIVAMMEAEGEGPPGEVAAVVAVTGTDSVIESVGASEGFGSFTFGIGLASLFVASCNWSSAISCVAGIESSAFASAWVLYRSISFTACFISSGISVCW